MSGLQRRRVHNASDSTPRLSATPRLDEDSGHRVAYDPRDIEESPEKSKDPRLTIMEEVLLIGLKDTQGYLSFWNDNISYTLRGCILIELAFRGRIAMTQDPARRRLALPDRDIEVINAKETGETLLDEALKLIKSSEPQSVGSWIDLLSGETWNLMKISYQLKQVRERLLKGLVDKGILRTEKRNFLLFDMATHPVSDTKVKDEIVRRIVDALTSRHFVLNSSNSSLLPNDIPFRYLRTVCLLCVCYAANVLENALLSLSIDNRDHAFVRVDDLLADFSQWPFNIQTGSSDPTIASSAGSSGPGSGSVPFAEEIMRELEENPNHELQLELIAAVLSVFTRLDSIL
ncbi:hypothetical protein CANCADRAFT_99628 [Tortispora caseinolytica NRRL Y-17796]|uniref:Vacuolar protein sorting-associated protein 74 n=1 Tax=Tortispora caseinolytica NRRL Y-17796 TaxID=767744 RepID=A0A1E4TE94_9ASCO|nr:hypothetical protein CANCADRAFT_99628 [Tortispora caseinolytica NRRL Y-17796]